MTIDVDTDGILAEVDAIASAWRSDRGARQARRHLERSDFEMLRAAGLLRVAVPVESGGTWRSAPDSIRDVCEAYRCLARADSSVALVSVMHPSVIAFWLASPDPSQPAWEEQRRAVFASAVAGDQWGTITSEPGSGGDIFRTRTTATPTNDAASFLPGQTYALAGDKHFGSGMGVTDRMMTTAVAEGEADPTIFVIDVRDRPWDGTAGLRLVAEWDGMGMAATQSHAMRLESAPSVRMAWNAKIDTITRNAGPLTAVLFTAVVLGVLDEAMSVARDQVRSRAGTLRAFEQIEWTRADQDHWLAVMAYEGAVRAIESGVPGAGGYAALRAKESVAELAEQTLQRLTRVLGGGTFSRRSPFAHWFEDVRALGFLRPPWGLAYDNLLASSIE
jgi:alkylation response protein AidB-like acyl-CoA dehydrogenase